MKINKSRFALLGILKYQDMSGYDIKKAIDGSVSNFWTEDYGRIYPELRQMEQDGYVTRIPEIKKNGPHRNIYKITEKGELEFEKWLKLPYEKQQTRNELLLKIFFGRGELIDNLIEKVEKEKEENVMVLKRYEQIEKKLLDEGNHQNQNESPFWQITLMYGKYKAQAVLKWCDESLESLKAMKENQQKQGEKS
jgi:PadR family transcriptional regulator, regulatory protein AphA